MSESRNTLLPGLVEEPLFHRGELWTAPDASFATARRDSATSASVPTNIRADMDDRASTGCGVPNRFAAQSAGCPTTPRPGQMTERLSTPWLRAYGRAPRSGSHAEFCVAGSGTRSVLQLSATAALQAAGRQVLVPRYAGREPTPEA